MSLFLWRFVVARVSLPSHTTPIATKRGVDGSACVPSRAVVWKGDRAKKTAAAAWEDWVEHTVMINVWLKRVRSQKQSRVSLTIHDLMSPKYPALHRSMGRCPHELRNFPGGRVGERYSLFISVSALVTLVKKRRVFMLPYCEHVGATRRAGGVLILPSLLALNWA